MKVRVKKPFARDTDLSMEGDEHSITREEWERIHKNEKEMVAPRRKAK